MTTASSGTASSRKKAKKRKGAKKSASGAAAKKKPGAKPSGVSSRSSEEAGTRAKSSVDARDDRSLVARLTELVSDLSGDLASGVQRLATEVGGAPLRIGRSLLLRPENARMAVEAGTYLRELRELAGLTRAELSDAVELQDQSLLRAVENGTATLSFELILRLAALLARHDPIPFVIRFTRTYNPDVWKLLEGWGLGRIPLQYERERDFVNIFRRHDAARKLSDEGFAKVLELTRAAFEMSLHFVAEQEHVPDEEVEV